MSADVHELTESLTNDLGEVTALMNAVKERCYANQDLLLCRDGRSSISSGTDLTAERALHVERTHAIFDAIERIVAHSEAIRAML